ncbi:MAG: tetratricopeptide repeat protein [Bryobacterales bacterium]|nr:tetratricopeptide repeat protein [Bryobacterales bacterium]
MNSNRGLAFVLTALLLMCTGVASAQLSRVRGKVIGEDGKPMQNAVIKIDRTDMKGNYQLKTNKKGEYLHAGIPFGGTYDVTLVVNGEDRDRVGGVRTKFGGEEEINFNLQELAEKIKATQAAAQEGTLTDDQTRGMSKEQKEAMEKALAERKKQMAKNTELNNAFNAGMEALQAKNYDAAVENFEKAYALDATQTVIIENMARAYSEKAETLRGDERNAALGKAAELYGKSLEATPNAPVYNNRGLILAKMGDMDGAKASLEQAAQLDPQNAGMYYYNLGAELVNRNNTDGAIEAFKLATTADPRHVNAHYQLAMSLIGKAQMDDKGNVIPPEGTIEALQKVVSLAPGTPAAEQASAMLETLSGSVDTRYTAPGAQKAKPGAAPAKRRN